MLVTSDPSCSVSSPGRVRWRIRARSFAMPSPVLADTAISSSAPPRRRCRSSLLPTSSAGQSKRARRHNSSSSSASGWDRSTTTSAQSASCKLCQDRSTPSDSIASPVARMPAVSTRSTGIPSNDAVSLIESRVVPAAALTIARSRSKRRLNRLDLPTFGRPTMARRKPVRTTLPTAKPAAKVPICCCSGAIASAIAPLSSTSTSSSAKSMPASSRAISVSSDCLMPRRRLDSAPLVCRAASRAW